MDDATHDRWFALNEAGVRLDRKDYPTARALRGESVQCRGALQRKARIETWVHVSATPLRDDEGGVTGAIVVANDIDEAKRAEIALRESEERLSQSRALLAAIFVQMPAALAVTDADGRFIMQNRRMAPYATDRVASKDPASAGRWQAWDSRGLPLDREMFPSARALRGEKHAFVEALHTAADGTKTWTHVAATPWRDETGAVSGAIVIITDIDPLKRAEQALLESQADLRQNRALLAATFEQMPVAIGVTDVSGRFVLKNSLLSRFARDVIPGLDDQTFDRWRAVDAKGARIDRTEYPAMRALRGEPHPAMEALYRDADGEETWAHVTATPLRGETGEVSGAIYMVADIDLTKRAELALRDSQQRIQLAAAATEVGIWEWNVQTGVTIWDDRMFRLHGLAPTEGGVADYDSWADCVLPEDLPRHQNEMFQFLRYGSGVHRFQFRVKRKSDGEIRVIEGVATLRADPQGQTQWVVGADLDITERVRAEKALRDSEERLRFALSGARAAAWGWTVGSGEQDWSPEIYALHGIDPATPPSYEAWAASILPEDRATVEAAVRACLEKRTATYHAEYRIALPSGEFRWLAALGQVEFSEGGAPARMSGINLDITAQKRAEEALRDSEERLRFALDGARAAAFDWNVVTGENVWSPQAYVLYGHASEKGPPSYDAFMDCVHPDDRERVEGAVLDALARRAPEYRAEFRVVHPDGEVLWLIGLGRVAFGADGKPLRMTGINLDITEQKRAEESLRLSQSRLRHAADAARLTFADIDLINDQVTVAENYAGVMGYTPLAEQSGKGVDRLLANLLKHVAPDDTPRLASALKNFYAGQLAGRVEYRTIGDDGLERWIEGVWIAELLPDGRPSRAFTTSLDISTLVEGRLAVAATKAKLEEILTSIADGFYALDEKWRFVYFNARAEKILKKKHADVIGRNFFDVFPQVRGTPLHETYRRAMTGGRPIDFECLSPILKKWTRFSVYPTAEGGISVYFRDISTQKAIESEIIAAKSEAERANRAKSKFLASASHDLRQPVQSLVLLLSLMERQVAANAKAIETTQMMKQALGGLNGLLTAILDISRLDAGVVEPTIERIDLGAMLRRLSGEYNAKARDKGLDFRVVDRDRAVMGDATLVERALRNLIENALRYTDRGGVLVSPRKRGRKIRIDVIDTGVGVPADKQTEIFDEFIQLNNPGRDLGQGLGLGLAIVARLVPLMNGKIELRSTPGRGSRFSLSLPAAEAPGPIDPRPQKLDDPGGRILIVEDNNILRQGLESIAQQWGCQTFAAASGEEALALASARQWRFDAIVTDYRLGAGMTGLEAAQEIARLAGRVFRRWCSPATPPRNIFRQSPPAASICCTSRSAPRI